MAIIYGKNTAVDYAAGNLASFGKSYSRMGAAPLDMYEVWYDLAELQKYASFRGNDASGNPVYDADTQVVDTSAVTSYVGQKVAYVNETENKIYHYSIELDGTLKEIGVAPIGDGKSISVNADGVVSVLGIESADSLTLPRMKADKSGIEWVPVSQVVEGDGNDNTTYTFTELIKGEGNTAETYGFVIKTFFNGVEVEGGTIEIAFDVYTKSEADAKFALKGEDAYDDTALTSRVAAIEGDYLKSADKYDDTELSNRVTAVETNKANAADVYTKNEVDTAIDSAVKGILGDGVNEAYDTLKEIQDILEGTNGETIDGLIESVADNKAKIEILNGDSSTAGSVDKKIADAIAPLATTEALQAVKEIAEAATTVDEVNAQIDTKIEAANLGQYATKQEITNAGYAVATEVANTYATKEELAPVAQTANNNATALTNLEDRVDGIAAIGGEPNTIDKIQVNGADLAITDKTVNIVVPTKLTDLTDGQSTLDAIAAADSKGAQGISDAAAVKVIADKNTQDITTLNQQLGTTNTNVSGLTTRIAALESEVGEVTNSRIDALEGVTSQHTTDISNNTAAITTLNTETIPAIQSAISSGDSANTNAIKAIYHKEGGAAATGILAEEITRATAAEQANAKAIADLAGEGNTSTVKANADAITALTNGAVKNNTDAIAIINGEDAGKSMRAVAHEEALRVETAAMEFMGVITELPTLTAADKGHFYKAATDIETGNKVSEINRTDNFYTDESETNDKTVLYFGANGEVSPENSTDWFETGWGPKSGRIVPTFACNKKIKVECLYQTQSQTGGDSVFSEIYTTTNYFDYQNDTDVLTRYCFKVTILEQFNFGQYSAIEPCTLVSIIDAITVPTDASIIEKGNSIVWDGHVWYVIPSEEDTWRPVSIAGTTLTNAENLAILAGENVNILRKDGGAFEISAIIPEVVHATMDKYGTVIGYTNSQEVNNETVIKTMVGMQDGKITSVSTDLLINGFNTLILNGGTASED